MKHIPNHVFQDMEDEINGFKIGDIVTIASFHNTMHTNNVECPEDILGLQAVVSKILDVESIRYYNLVTSDKIVNSLITRINWAEKDLKRTPNLK